MLTLAVTLSSLFEAIAIKFGASREAPTPISGVEQKEKRVTSDYQLSSGQTSGSGRVTHRHRSTPVLVANAEAKAVRENRVGALSLEGNSSSQDESSERSKFATSSVVLTEAPAHAADLHRRRPPQACESNHSLESKFPDNVQDFAGDSRGTYIDASTVGVVDDPRRPPPARLSAGGDEPALTTGSAAAASPPLTEDDPLRRAESETGSASPAGEASTRPPQWEPLVAERAVTVEGPPPLLEDPTLATEDMARYKELCGALGGLSLGDTAGEEPLTPEMRQMNRFPFIVDNETVRHVRRSRVMFVMRGLPGSGKSTIVRLLMEVYPRAVVCSADDHFRLRDGRYHFQREKLPEAHSACQQRARAACQRGAAVVVIDNTNVRMWEMTTYTKMAADHGYVVVVVEPRTPWRNDPIALARRNKHGVSVDLLRQKLRTYDTGVPLYYGWFLNQTHSDLIEGLVNKYFTACRRAYPDFASLVKAFAGGRAPHDFHEVYDRAESSSETLHCTAFFADRGAVPEAESYRLQESVKRALGRVTTLEVIGVVFSPRTVGARVRLSSDHLLLWGKDDEEGLEAAGRRGTRGRPQAQATGGRSSKFRPVVGEGSRAHLTLGYRPESKAVQTGLDLVQVVRCEQEGVDLGQPAAQLDGAVARCYEGQYWTVYLDRAVPVDALFSGGY